MTRAVLFLIRMVTPAADREWVVGDTLEELERVERVAGAAEARAWLRRELWRVLLAAPRHRIAARGMAGARQHGRSSRWTVATGDVRDAWRGLRSGRGTTALAFVILTLTIAAGTVTFSVVDAVALRPLPYASPESLVAVGRVTEAGTTAAPSQDFFSWQEGATTAFDAIAASRFSGQLRLQGSDGEGLAAAEVTSNLFDVLGIRPVAGRFVSREHEQPGQDAVVVLSHGLWMRRFGGDPGAIGTRVTFVDIRDRRITREIIGVLPPGVTYPMTAAADPDVFVPYVPGANDRSHAFPGRVYALWVVGRLRPGATIEQARAEIELVSATVGVSAAQVRVMPLHDRVAGHAKAWLLLALAAIGFVLLAACANVANLLLARATVRAREFATREALGASRRRLAGGLLLEGLILALASGAAGLVLSWWGVELARANLPTELRLARVSEIAIDGRVLLTSIAAAVACSLVSASAPAWLASRSDFVGLMKAGGGVVLGGRRRDRALSAFLVADVALVCLVLVAVVLVVTSFVRVTTADLGFDRQHVVALQYVRPLENVEEANRPAVAAALRAELLDRVKGVPGVVNAAVIAGSSEPMSGGSTSYSIVIPGFGETRGEDMLETRMVTRDYFGVMGMQLIRGRLFESSDRAGAPPVMLINDAAVRKFFRDRDPLGQVVTFRDPTTIVGVLRGVHFRGPEADVRPEMYIPAEQDLLGSGVMTSGTLAVRTAGDPRRLAPALREAIRPALGGVEPGGTRVIDDSFRRLTASRRFNAGVMATFGVIALVLGAIGTYGTMAFVVAQQVRAIGLRMALGASPARMLRAVLRRATWHVAAGVAIGLAGAWTASNAFTAFVFGIRPTEPVVYAAVGGFLVLVGVVAALVPALRAARIDPLAALRQE